MLDVELVVHLGEDEDLRPPVLGVGRALLQAEEGEAGRGEGEAANSVAPLFLGPAKQR